MPSKSRVFLYLLLLFIIGVAVRSFVSVPIGMLWGSAMASAIAIVIGILRQKPYMLMCGFFVLAVFLGIFRYELAVQTRPDLSGLLGSAQEAAGIVRDSPVRTEKSQRLKVYVDRVYGDALNTPFFVLVTLNKFPIYEYGDELHLEGVLERPQNFDEFDYVSYLAKDNIFSTMSFPVVQKIGSGKGSKIKSVLFNIKHKFESRLDQVLPEPHNAFLKGLLLGERQSLPKELTEQFARTGTTHIIALSGYNITLVGRFFTGVLLALTVPFQIAFWVALVSIIFFVVLVGGMPSIVRAGIMGILVLIARREGRVYDMTNALVLAGALMIGQNPMILRFDVAFQLSFLATFGLVYLTSHTERSLDHVIRFLRRSVPAWRHIVIRKKPSTSGRLFDLRQLFVETMSAQLMVLPLLMYLFGRISIVSPLTNILVLITVPYSMGIGFLTGALGFIWLPLSQASGVFNWVLLEYKIRVIEFFSRLPLASVEIGTWAVLPLLLIYLWILWRVYMKGKRIKTKD